MKIKFLGFHEAVSLPIKPGDTVTIGKGTKIRKTDGKGWRLAGRTHKVRVHHILPGCTKIERWPDDPKADKDGFVTSHLSNPFVVWAGSGGYWTEADINDIPEAHSG